MQVGDTVGGPNTASVLSRRDRSELAATDRDRSRSASPAPRTDGRYREDQRLEHLAGMQVHARRCDCRRHALGLGQHVRLAALLAAIHPPRPGQRDPLCARTEAVSTVAEVQSSRPWPRVRPAPLGAASRRHKPTSGPHREAIEAVWSAHARSIRVPAPSIDVVGVGVQLVKSNARGPGHGDSKSACATPVVLRLTTRTSHRMRQPLMAGSDPGR